MKRLLFLIALALFLPGTARAQLLNPCNQSVSLPIASAGDQQYIAAPTNVTTQTGWTLSTLQSVHICAILIGVDTGASTGTFSLDAGTGTNCGTNTVSLINQLPANTLSNFDMLLGLQPLVPWFNAPAGTAVCVNFSVAPTLGGVTIIYDVG